MKKTLALYLVSMSFLAMSCGGETKTEEPAGDTTAKEQVEIYGDSSITPDGAMNMTEFVKAIQGKDSMEVKLTATINQCCKKKGCWMTVDMENGEEMRVTFKDYGFFVPKNADGMKATFQGWAFVDTISVDMQKHYLEDEGASKEEIDAITQAKAEWSFVANGVIINSNGKK